MHVFKYAIQQNLKFFSYKSFLLNVYKSIVYIHVC